MKTKSIVQLLIPAASTVGLFLVFWLLSFVIWVIGYLLFGFLKLEPGQFGDILGEIYHFLQVNIFEYRDVYNGDVNINMVVFWILNVILIIIGELWASDDDNY